MRWGFVVWVLFLRPIAPSSLRLCSMSPLYFISSSPPSASTPYLLFRPPHVLLHPPYCKPNVNPSLTSTAPRPPLPRARARALNVEGCRLPEWMLFIDEQARVAPCSFTIDAYGQPTSSIRDVTGLQQLQAAFMARQASAPAAPCVDCHSTQLFAKFAA